MSGLASACPDAPASTTVRFSSRGEVLAGRWTAPATGLPTGPPVLFVAGGGRAPAEAVLGAWQQALARFGTASLCFDFRGIGASSGDLAEDSIGGRVTDTLVARDVLRDLSGASSCVLAGNSMGAHVAVRAATRRPSGIRGLVLRGAAAYAARAEPCRFGPELRAVLHEPRSWCDSPVFTDLARLAVPVLVIYAERDEVVPEEVRTRLLSAAGAQVEHLQLHGVGHQHDSGDPAGEAAWRLTVSRTMEFLAAIAGDTRVTGSE